jgi:DNA invertase Pin-like site-specific DNA recombinase
MKVGLYTRVSTETQTRGESLADQDHDGRAWCAGVGYTVAASYSDPGLSGCLPASERPGLTDALEALQSGSIDGLVIRDLDRLARELTVQEAVLSHIWSRPDTHVFTYSSGREVLRDDPDDPMRTAMRQMQGVFAQLDRAMLVKKLRDARRNKARRGQHANGPAPYGWRSQDGELIPVPAELAIVDEVRTHRAAGMNQTQIAAALNEAGHVTREGCPWSQQVVSRALRPRSPEQVAYHERQLALHS